MTVDASLREAARKGGFRLNVWKTDTGHQANFSRDGNSWRVVIDADPIAAILGALAEPAPPSPPAEDIFG